MSEKPTNVREIIRAYLIANSYDGLCREDCGCRVDDLVPCESNPSECVPGDEGHVLEAQGWDFVIYPRPSRATDLEASDADAN